MERYTWKWLASFSYYQSFVGFVKFPTTFEFLGTVDQDGFLEPPLLMTPSSITILSKDSLRETASLGMDFPAHPSPNVDLVQLPA